MDGFSFLYNHSFEAIVFDRLRWRLFEWWHLPRNPHTFPSIFSQWLRQFTHQHPSEMLKATTWLKWYISLKNIVFIVRLSTQLLKWHQPHNCDGAFFDVTLSELIVVTQFSTLARALSIAAGSMPGYLSVSLFSDGYKTIITLSTTSLFLFVQIAGQPTGR